MMALEVLKKYEQADEEGIMVLVSRQALDEVLDWAEDLVSGQSVLLPKTEEQAQMMVALGDRFLNPKKYFPTNREQKDG